MLRFLDEDGDGLDISPENRRNINGLDPKRALNSALRLEIGRFSLGIDTVDYRHTYFVNEQDSVQGVLLESADTFNLGYHNQFISAKYRQPLGQAVELAPYLHLQHYDNPGSYGWFSDFPVTSGDDGSMTATWKSTLVETSKESFHVLGGTDVQARLGSSHLLLGGLGIDNNRILALEDLVFASGSTEPDSSRFHLSESEGHDIVDVFAFLQETWSATWWLEATGGLRADYHSLSGPFLSPRAGLLFIPSSTATVKLLYGSAFRAPNARELLVEVGRRDSGENYFTSGNPDLVHERIDTVEAEVLGDLTRWLKLRGGLFFSQTTNEIDKYTETRSTAWGRLGNSYYKNYGGSDALGAEVESVIRFDIGEFGVSYVYTRARDKSTGHAQYEFPPHMAHFRGTARPAEGLRVSLLGDWYGTRPRSDWTPDSKRPDGPSFLLLHAAAATDLLAHGRLRADLSIRNLLDTNYETLVYRDQANEVESDGSPSNPRDLQGDGRAIVIGLETQF
jgi:outer membrane receptor for ferrienterochelin and colicin